VLHKIQEPQKKISSALQARRPNMGGVTYMGGTSFNTNLIPYKEPGNPRDLERYHRGRVGLRPQIGHPNGFRVLVPSDDQ